MRTEPTTHSYISKYNINLPLLTNRKCDHMFRLRIMTFGLFLKLVHFHNGDAVCFYDTKAERLDIVTMVFSI